MSNAQAAKIVSRIDKLVSLPASVQRVLAGIDAPRSTARTVAELVDEDPPLAARVLRLANSGFYARSVRATDVKQAVARIGLEETRTAVAAAVLGRLFASRSGARFDFIDLYAHGLASSLVAQVLYKHCRHDGAVLDTATQDRSVTW